MAAASSLLSTSFHSPFSRSPNSKPLLPPPLTPSFYLRNAVALHKNRNHSYRIFCFFHRVKHTQSLTSNKPLFTRNPLSSSSSSSSSSSFVDSLLVLYTSVALSFSLFLADVDSASAFVVNSPRKLQTDELATVRLFQENTPSVVYITNLAVKYLLQIFSTILISSSFFMVFDCVYLI